MTDHIIKYVENQTRVQERFGTRKEAEDRAAVLIAQGLAVTIRSVSRRV